MAIILVHLRIAIVLLAVTKGTSGYLLDFGGLEMVDSKNLSNSYTFLKPIVQMRLLRKRRLKITIRKAS